MAETFDTAILNRATPAVGEDAIDIEEQKAEPQRCRKPNLRDRIW